MDTHDGAGGAGDGGAGGAGDGGADMRPKVVGTGVVTYTFGRCVQGMVTVSAGESSAELQFQRANRKSHANWAELVGDAPTTSERGHKSAVAPSADGRLVVIGYDGFVDGHGSTTLQVTETHTIVRGADRHHAVELTLPLKEGTDALRSIADVVSDVVSDFSSGGKAWRGPFDWRAGAEPDGTDAFVASTCHVAVPRADAAVEAIASVGFRATQWRAGVRLAHVNRAPAAAWAALARGDPGSIATADPCESNVIADRATSPECPAEWPRKAAPDPCGWSRSCVASDGAVVTFSVSTPCSAAIVRAPLGVCAPALAEVARVVAGLESEVVAGDVADTAAANAAAAGDVAGDDTKKGGARGGRPPGRWARLATWRPAWWRKRRV
jgi:hypothetical protein